MVQFRRPLGFLQLAPLSVALALLHAMPNAVQSVSAQSQDLPPHPPITCGKVTVADLNWASASIIAHIDEIILESAFGCSVELIKGDTLSVLNSMLREQTPDVAPETWINSARDLLDEAVASGELHYLSPVLSDGGVEGWWIPAYLAEAHPEIKTVADALKRPDLFPAPDGTGAAIHGCPEGWSCAVSTRNLFDAYDADAKGFDLIAAEDGAALEASIERAFRFKQGWLGYYWAPTAALGRYDMVKLSFDAPYDDTLWHECIIDPDCPSPQVTAWPRSEVYTVATDAFVRSTDGAQRYLAKRTFGNDVVNDLLAWQADNAATPRATAEHFLVTYPELWQTWLAEDDHSKVMAALRTPG